MNEDIATMVATRPAERRVQRENQALNEFRDRLARVRVEFAHRDDELELPLLFAVGRHRARLREMHIAVARVAVQLARIGGES